jgi:hypothetical protein
MVSCRSFLAMRPRWLRCSTPWPCRVHVWWQGVQTTCTSVGMHTRWAGTWL